MTDWLWSLATSWAQWVAVAVLLVSLVGYFPFADKIPIVGPYARVARLVAFLSFGLVCALVDRRSADGRAEIARLRVDLAFSEMQLSNQLAAAAVKAKLADASAAAAVDAQMKANDYETRLSAHPVGDCGLDDDDISGMQNIRPRRAGAVNRGGADPSRLRRIGEGIFNAVAR